MRCKLSSMFSPRCDPMLTARREGEGTVPRLQEVVCLMSGSRLEQYFSCGNTCHIPIDSLFDIASLQPP